MTSWLIGLFSTASGVMITYVATQICVAIHRNTTKYKELKKKEEDERLTKVVDQSLEPKFDKIDDKLDGLDKKVSKVEEDLGSVKEGTQASLRADLYRLFDECQKKGYATQDERNNFINLYEKYHNLGANGVMDDIHNQFLELPSQKPLIKSSAKKRLAE